MDAAGLDGAELMETVETWPPPLEPADEAQHPEWPAINDAVQAAEGCATVRAGYNRTRCCAPSCRRCWNGGEF